MEVKVSFDQPDSQSVLRWGWALLPAALLFRAGKGHKLLKLLAAVALVFQFRHVIARIVSGARTTVTALLRGRTETAEPAETI